VDNALAGLCDEARRLERERVETLRQLDEAGR
jgi:hypothetical protein